MATAFKANLTGLENLVSIGVDVGAAVQHGLDVLAEAAEQKKLEFIEETYLRPIPGGVNGSLKWARSGDWKNEQTIEAFGSERLLGSRGHSEEYEGYLADLPTGADGINRTNAAAQKTQDWLEENGQDIFERAVYEFLSR